MGVCIMLIVLLTIYHIHTNLDLANVHTVVITPENTGGSDVFIKLLLKRYPNTLEIRSLLRGFRLRLGSKSKFASPKDVFELLKSTNIKKVFINHMAFMNYGFIEEFFRNIPQHLVDNIYSITHDYFWTYTLIHPNFGEEINAPISKFDKFIPQIHFISQCDSTARNVFVKSEPRSLTIIPPPDHHLSEYSLKCDDELHFGAIGNFGQNKGSDSLITLSKHLQKHEEHEDIKLSIIGRCSGIKGSPFASIEEFNAILSRHRPNVLLFPSNCPETYSYTLTLAMLSKVLIVLKTCPYEYAMSERLRGYANYIFDDFTDLDRLITRCMTAKSQYIHTVTPEINVDEAWNKIFLS